MSNYPPGVTGLEPELTGEWPCTSCGRTLNDTTCCPCESCADNPDHCIPCCTSGTDETGD